MLNVILRLIINGAVLFSAAQLTQVFFGDDAAIVITLTLALLVLAYHETSARQLNQWLTDPKLEKTPYLKGFWGEACSRIYRSLKTHQRQQHMLTQSLLAFRNAAQALPDGVITINKDNQINWCNETAQAHFGLNAARDTGQVIHNLVRDPDFVSFIKERHTDFSTLIRSPKNNRLFLLLQRVKYGEDQTLILSRDITEREKLERMRRDFVANVSHELKTPLTVLLGFLETLQELNLNETQRHNYLKLMDEQGKRMRSLIEDLLTLSFLEANVQPLQDQIINGNQLMQQLLTDAKALSAGRHTIELKNQINLNIKGQDREIASAFGNLVSNAVRYTPEGGKINLNWKTTANGDVLFSVQDSGIGILPEHVPRLTERFYRIDRSRSRETGGTGLGLAIVKHVLTRHQGYLNIQSEIGKGSTFSAVLPAQRKL